MTTSNKGHLKNFENEGLFIITKKKTTHVSRRYFYSSNSSITTQKALESYSHRWQIENDFWTLKEHLGIQDFRFQNLNTVEAYLSVVLLTFNFLCKIKNLESYRINSIKVKTGVCDVLAKFRFRLKEFIFENNEDSINILLNEFMRQRSQSVALE